MTDEHITQQIKWLRAEAAIQQRVVDWARKSRLKAQRKGDTDSANWSRGNEHYAEQRVQQLTAVADTLAQLRNLCAQAADVLDAIIATAEESEHVRDNYCEIDTLREKMHEVGDPQ